MAIKIGTSYILQDVEVIKNNWIVGVYAQGKKRPYSYALFNDEVLTDNGEPVIKLLFLKPKRFKPLWEDKSGIKHFDIDWLEDHQDYNDITGKVAGELIQAIKEEYANQEK